MKAKPRSSSYIWAPYRRRGATPAGMRHKCNGISRPFPWEYQVTAVIPVLDTAEMLKYAVALLRHQTVKPFIQVVDTGSTPSQWKRIASLQANDLELISLRLNGYQHRSDPVAMAMDCAFATVRTPYVFATHADVFLRRRGFLADLLRLCKRHPVVGYRLSPREHAGWRQMVGHTATMFRMDALEALNARWSLAEWYRRNGYVKYDPAHTLRNVPDTEFNINAILKENRIKPFLVGKEGNDTQTLDRNLRHIRSTTLVRLYTDPSSPRRIARNRWWQEAKQECKKLLRRWTQRPIPRE